MVDTLISILSPSSVAVVAYLVLKERVSNIPKLIELAKVQIEKEYQEKLTKYKDELKNDFDKKLDKMDKKIDNIESLLKQILMSKGK